jgi:hypothetical protein
MHLTGPDKKRWDNHSLKNAHVKIPNFVDHTHPALTELLKNAEVGYCLSNHKRLGLPTVDVSCLLNPSSPIRSRFSASISQLCGFDAMCALLADQRAVLQYVD